jgi:hypothetical protein
MEIRNAIITDVMLGREDHGIFTFYIGVNLGNCECYIGGYALDEFDKIANTRVFRPESMEIISKILDVVGVDKWENLPGKYIRVKAGGWGDSIDEIGNIMEEKWLNFREFFSHKQKG